MPVSNSPSASVVWTHVYSVALVAFVLTIAEVATIVGAIFPDLQRAVKGELRRLRDGPLLKETESRLQGSSLALLKTLVAREQMVTASNNGYILKFAILFIIILGVFMVVSFIRSRQLGGGVWLPLLSVLLTLLLIGYFQGFPCILWGKGSLLCSESSFIRTTAQWAFNTDIFYLVLQTGVCDGVQGEATLPTTKDIVEDTVGTDTVSKDLVKRVTDRIDQDLPVGQELQDVQETSVMTSTS